jgi:PTH1 family peptidyl-tRNA hydrolase
MEANHMSAGLLEAELARVKRIVAGLGNPGEEYARTRHNVGFRAVDAFLKAEGIPKLFEGHSKSRLQIIELDGITTLLVKPTTYMNLSGTAVSSALDVTGLSGAELLVVHDDMDLPLGRAKMKVGGGAAGHKGVADIIEHCGEEFARIKIGIGRPEETGEEAAINWVLGEIGPEEEEVFVRLLPVVATAIRRWVVDGVEKSMTWFNTELKAEEEEVEEVAYTAEASREAEMEETMLRGDDEVAPAVDE